jgi:aldehyde:ferredoxin oxidoreductase
MYGYGGGLLRINLSTGRIEKEPIEKQDILDFVGGRGFGIKYLYKEVPAKIDPLSPENKLILATGVLGGTTAQTASRWVACTKSPLTGCYARASGGGDFGAWLKFAGYDFILIEGKADKPVYVHITREGARLEDAREIWGKTTELAQDWLAQRYGRNTRTACIGPAGENLVKFAAIVTGRRTASRCGVGTVMGSKNLKAVSITTDRNITLYNPDEFARLVKEQVGILTGGDRFKGMSLGGTTQGAPSRNNIGVFPVRNFRFGQIAGIEKITGEGFSRWRTGHDGCYGCPIRCGQIHEVTSGPYTGAKTEGPEYESVWAFTGPIDSACPEAAIAADQMCDDLGMDTISTGSTIGFAYELFEKGILTKGDTDGLELTYGNHAAMVELVKKIGRREGFGNILAEGSRRAAEIIGKGSDYYTMQSKGLEMAAYEPRGLKATGFGYATSNIGASHGNGSLAFQEWGAPVPRAVDRFTEEGKADIVIYNQNNSALNEVGVICVFVRDSWAPRLFGKMLAAATGIGEFADWGYLSQVGDRIVNLDHAFNVRDGFDRRQDTLPRRVQTEPLHTLGAPGEGQMVRTLDKFLDEYYQLRGWTRNGIPTREKLESLGLGWAAKDIAAFLK